MRAVLWRSNLLHDDGDCFVATNAPRNDGMRMKFILFSNTSWYLYNYRLPLVPELKTRGEVTLVAPPDDYSARFKEEGIRWLSFPLSRRGMNPFAELLTIFRLARLYRRERPDLVHHFTIKCMLYGSIAARMAGVRSVVNSVTGLGYVFSRSDWRGRLLNAFVRGFYRFTLRGTQVIFQNADDRNHFVREGLIDAGQASLIRGSGVDLTRYEVRDEAEGTPIVLLAARLLWDKGVAEFVEAARRIRTSGLVARFVIVGDTDAGNPSAIPAEQLRAWNDAGDIEWWGWRDDMPEVIASSHIVCLPTYYKEGLPRLLLEGAACARPLIATDIPGCREIVTHNVNGLLVPPRNVDALTDALRALLTDSNLRAQMGTAGRVRVENNFSVEHVNQATWDVYERALGVIDSSAKIRKNNR